MIENYMWIVWLSIFVISLIFEIATTALVSIWFIGGSFVAFCLSFIPNFPFWGEIIIFIGVSLILFLLLRPALKKLMKKRIINSNADVLVGKKAKVKEKITSLNNGSVILNGIIWTAVSDHEQDIDVNDVVLIKAVEGNKLVVCSYKEGEK